MLEKFVNRWVSLNQRHSDVLIDPQTQNNFKTNAGFSYGVSNEAKKGNVSQSNKNGRRKRLVCDDQSTVTAMTGESSDSQQYSSGALASHILSDDEARSILSSHRGNKRDAGTTSRIIDMQDLVFLERIGLGSNGATYFGRWILSTDRKNKTDESVDVAIKVATSSENGEKNWNAERNVLQSLSFMHPNIVAFFGTSVMATEMETDVESECKLLSSTRCLVFEHCNAGDLWAALQYPTHPNFVLHVSQSVATGIAFLHNQRVLHRDIKPENILLHGDLESNNFTVKLADLGLAKYAVEGEENTAETGTYRYMAPEVLRHESYTYSVDVYSYAILFWQLITRETPFSLVSQIEAASRVALNRERPLLPKNIPSKLKRLIKRCWQEKATNRPTMTEIEKEIHYISKNLSKKDRLWINDSNGHPIYSNKTEKRTIRT